MLLGPYRPTISDLLKGMRRRALMIGSIFTLVFVIALATAVLFPPVYRSTGIIQVESQQIPADLIPTTVITLADERIQMIRQRIMTRKNQMRIIDKYGLFSDAVNTMSASQMLETMRDSTEVTPIQAGRGKRGATIAFEIAFEHRSPETSRAVANELVTLFLNENVRSRTERASETTLFLTREAAKLETELSSIEAKLATHKQRYSDALPEHLKLRMAMLQRAEADLRSVQRESKATLEETRFMDVELSAAQAGLDSTADPRLGTSNEEQTLGALKRDYARLSQSYTDRHPDLMALNRRIGALENEAAQREGAPSFTGMTGAELRIAKIQTRLDASGSRLVSLQEHEQALRTRIQSLENQIVKTPQVQRELSRLMRDYGNAQAKYEEMREKQLNAEIAESLEQQEKAERFSLLEPPTLPDTPVKPNRSKIMLLGFFLAAGSSAGFAIMLETLSRRVHGAGALTQLMGRTPLVVIPYITTTSELRRRRTRRILGLLIILGLIITATITIHFAYMQLDHLFLKIADRLG